jgi:hypothetical protein
MTPKEMIRIMPSSFRLGTSNLFPATNSAAVKLIPHRSMALKRENFKTLLHW